MKKAILWLAVTLLCFVGCAEGTSVSRQKPLAIYRGIALNRNDRDTDEDDDLFRDILQRYNREYFAYSNGEFLGKCSGRVVGRGLDYYWDIQISDLDIPGEILLSEDYNPYPRKAEYLSAPCAERDFSSDITMTNRYFDVNVEIIGAVRIDLDGDSKNEYLVCLEDTETHSLYIRLLDGRGNLISYLFAATHEEDPFEYDFENDVEIIDIDNDGVMEIIVTLLSYEGFNFNCYKYQNGIFYGGWLNECTMNR